MFLVDLGCSLNCMLLEECMNKLFKLFIIINWNRIKGNKKKCTSRETRTINTTHLFLWIGAI